MNLHIVLARRESFRSGLIQTVNKLHDEELDFKPFRASEILIFFLCQPQ